MTKYTDKMIAELRGISGLNYDSATAFADKYGITVRSVIAKARALEVPYTPKDPKIRSTKKVGAQPKSAVITSIEKSIGTELKSLDKMTVPDLLALKEILTN